MKIADRLDEKRKEDSCYGNSSLSISSFKSSSSGALSSNSNDILPTAKEEERKTDWKSIHTASALAFSNAVQFSIYFTSLWPYLQQIDGTATETFFGYIIAIYSLGQAIASPVFGYWSVKRKIQRIPVFVGVLLMFLGNLLYMTIDLLPSHQRYMMLTSRLITGVGGGMISVLRAYSVMASTDRTRSRAIAETTGSFALGITFGPAFQIIFSPIGYPGWRWFGRFGINVYTAPAFTACIVNIISSFCLFTIFKEQIASERKKKQESNDGKERFLAVPSFDRLAAFVCICTRFAQMFVITNLETIGSPYSMTMFKWTKAQAVLNNSIMQGCFGFFGFVIYVSYIVFDLSRCVHQRLCCMAGLALIIVFHLITFPWPGLPGKLEYRQQTIIVNGTEIANPDEPVGCRETFKWCENTPPVNMYLYMISYVLLVGLAFAAINIAMNTIFSTILGPRNQGSMQGFLVLAGSFARLLGPLFVANLFSSYGPRAVWGMEMGTAGAVLIFWAVMFKRMVPLKGLKDMVAGDVLRNKYGLIYHF